MSCNICYVPFNRTDHIPKVMICCSRSICLFCCKKLDQERTNFCPYCKAKALCEFSKLNNNLDFIDSLPEWTATKCPDHDKLNSMICETCEKEICTKCIQSHTQKGHSIVDIEAFLFELETQKKDYRLWLNRAKEKYSMYDKMIQIRKDMLKSAVKKKYQETIVSLQTCQEQAMSAIDERFKSLDMKAWYSEGTSGKFLDMKQVIGQCHEVFGTEGEKDIMNVFNFCQLKRLPVLKKWADKDEMDTFKMQLNKVDFEFNVDLSKHFKLFNKEVQENEQSGEMVSEDPINPTETLEIKDNNTQNIFWNPERVYQLKKVDVFDLQDIKYTRQMLPGAKYVKNLKLTIPEAESITDSEIKSFFQDFVIFSQLQKLELVDNETPPADFFSMLLESLTHFRFLKSVIIHGNFNYQLADINKIIRSLNPEVATGFGLLSQPECVKNMESILESLKGFKKLEEIKLGTFVIYDQGSIEGLRKFIAEKTELRSIEVRFILDSSARLLSLSFKELFRTISELPFLRKLAITHNSDKISSFDNFEYFDEEIFRSILSKRMTELKIHIPQEAIPYDFFKTHSDFFEGFLIDLKTLELSSTGYTLLESYINFLISTSKYKETLNLTLKLKIQPSQLDYFVNNFLAKMLNSKSKLDLKVRGFDEDDGATIERIQRSYPEAKITLSAGKVFHHVTIQC